MRTVYKKILVVNIIILFFGLVSTLTDLYSPVHITPEFTKWTAFTYTHYYHIDVNGTLMLLGTSTINVLAVSIMILTYINILLELILVAGDFS